MGQITDVISSSGLKMPNVSSMLIIVMGFAIMIIVVVTLGVLAWWIYNRLTYTKRIIIFEKVGDRFQNTGVDSAKEVTIGVGGERVLYLKKRKVWKVGEKQTNDKTYWFAILDDGYWYNFTLGDLNKKLGEFETTGISPEIHKLMRYQSAGLRKNLEERHIKKKWFEHPLVPWIAAMLFVIITGVFFIMIGNKYFEKLPTVLDQQNTLTERTNALIEQGTELTRAMTNLLDTADNICNKQDNSGNQNGSG
jgi:membrane protein implicated in regulation of membrane protease activity